MKTTLSRRIAVILHDEITEGFGIERLAALTHTPKRTILNVTEGICCPLDKILTYVEAIGQVEPHRALRIWDRISALAAYEVRPMPTAIPGASAAALALKAGAAEGRVEEWAGAALEDGHLDPFESVEGEKVIRDARHALDTLGAAVRGVAVRAPQVRMAVAP